MKLTHYQILEVCPQASLPTIRAAYKSLMQRHHPDRNGADPRALARTQALTAAYEVLADAERRARYDDAIGLNRSQKVFRHHESGGCFPAIRDEDCAGLHEPPSTVRILRLFSGVMRAAEYAGRGDIIHLRV